MTRPVSAPADDIDEKLVMALWGFKSWVETDLAAGTIIASDDERHMLWTLIRRIDRLMRQAMRRTAEGTRS